MVSQYVLRPLIVMAIPVDSVSAQASDIAAMIKAKTFSVDVDQKTAIFYLEDKTTIEASSGQVVALVGANVTVFSSEQFASLYQQYLEK